MKIAVISAMQKELDLFLSQMGGYAEEALEDMTIYKGKMGVHDIVAVQCGIGKVNSALRTSSLIKTYSPELVINSGVAGGISEKMEIGDIVIADSVSYHDVWCGPGTEYGAADGNPVYLLPSQKALTASHKAICEEERNDVHYGLVCSGDKFITTPKQIEEIQSHFPDCLCCEMESASIAQTCRREGVDFMIVRVLSDRPGSGKNISEYEGFWSAAPAKTFEVVRSIIEQI